MQKSSFVPIFSKKITFHYKLLSIMEKLIKSLGILAPILMAAQVVTAVGTVA